MSDMDELKSTMKRFKGTDLLYKTIDVQKNIEQYVQWECDGCSRANEPEFGSITMYTIDGPYKTVGYFRETLLLIPVIIRALPFWTVSLKNISNEAFGIIVAQNFHNKQFMKRYPLH